MSSLRPGRGSEEGGEHARNLYCRAVIINHGKTPAGPYAGEARRDRSALALQYGFGVR